MIKVLLKWTNWTVAMIYLIAPALSSAAVVPPGVQLSPLQELVRGNRSEVESLDPHKTTGLTETNIIHEILEGLVNFGPKGEIVPGVAQSWQSSDQKTWIFSLRPEAKWSNGDPVTAEDFVYSWQRLADPNTASPYSSYLDDIQLQNSTEVLNGRQPVETLGIQALDAQTLKITLSQPLSYLIKMLAHTSLKPLHRASIEKYGDQWTQPGNQVGNGAYRMQEWVVNERITLIRNTQYWDDSRTVINQVKYLPIQDHQEIARYRSSELDMIYDTVPSATFQQLKQEYKKELHKIPSVGTYHYQLNCRQPPFNNVKVRQAVALALDKRALVEKVKGQWDTVADCFTPPAIDGAPVSRPEWATWTQKKRIKAAKALLQEAGYNSKNPLKFSILHDSVESHQRLAIAASTFWKVALGAEITLESQEWKSYLENRRLGNFQMARAMWVADYNEASAFLNILLPGSSTNYSGYDSPQFVNWGKQALGTSNETQRQVYYQKAEAQLATDMPTIPVYHFVDARLIKPYVQGYSTQNPTKIIHTKDLYITQH
ncbi:ABC transporter substrate-binding protein [unidentified bacterial endosymbiont]|uniref:ABC transporter substrate-binding protein n=1 Tax=unidentified bacterial endosymbiont TaxID=2355 RepID=UPI0020A05C9C|nr:ABC transporter substrate-binding protein [unidentified bacterial endosymbiont]